MTKLASYLQCRNGENVTRIVLLGVVLGMLNACTTAPERQNPPTPTRVASIGSNDAHSPLLAADRQPDDNLNATLWSQTAIEHDLIYQEVYRDAQSHLLTALKDRQWDALPKQDRLVPLSKSLRPAVILDIDETVLDNSPFEAQLIHQHAEYNPATWTAWCKEERARAMPGAVAFTQFAARHGIAVIYLSNRAQELDQVTTANLRQAGFPVSGPDAFLGLGTQLDGCKQTGSAKDCRRRLVSQHYRVLMQIGDQLGDFINLPRLTPAQRAQALEPYTHWIGERWFVLPNPMYGDWESAAFNAQYSLPVSQRRQLKIDAVK